MADPSYPLPGQAPYPPPPAYGHAAPYPPAAGSSAYPPSAAYPPQPASDPYGGKGAGGASYPVNNEPGGGAKYPPTAGAGAGAMGSTSPMVVSPQPPESRFAPPSGPQDLWAAIVFLVHLVGFGVIAAIGFSNVDLATMSVKGYPRNSPSSGSTGSSSGSGSSSGGTPIEFGPSAISSIVIGCLVAGGASMAYLWLMAKYPKQLIKGTFIASILFYLAMGVLSFVLTKNFIVGIICVLFAIFGALAYRAFKSRMPFAAVMLSTVTGVTTKYTGTLWLALASLLVNLAYTVLFVVVFIVATVYWVTTAATVNERTGQTQVGAITYVVWVYLAFSFYFTSQVLRNSFHCTVAGVFASFYFMSGSPQGMPANPTLSALKRTLTTSFGSVCYGSLIIAIVQTLRAVINQARQNNDNAAMAFVLCCIDCILSCIEGLLEAMNHYAFCQVAIYGKDYCRAAKDTWTMVKDRGVDLLINDCLIGNVLSYGSLLVAGFTTAITWVVYVAARAAAKEAAVAGFDVMMLIVLILAFCIGAIMFSLVSVVIDSGVASTFVCLAEDPAALQQTKPELWDKIRETYPQAAFLSMYSA
ncbi:pH nine-sensitive protein 1 [Blastocladiella emersonii ATCC 22665]|nr:pH nine-sensitive protein 1 [Blastocladiella emersonii ATCC 22665]